MSLASTEWLQQNIDKIKIIDCSWHMPNSKRNGNEEYQKEHIPNAIFFDLDKNSDQNTDLPHMLTDRSSWKKIVSSIETNKFQVPWGANVKCLVGQMSSPFGGQIWGMN